MVCEACMNLWVNKWSSINNTNVILNIWLKLWDDTYEMNVCVLAVGKWIDQLLVHTVSQCRMFPSTTSGAATQQCRLCYLLHVQEGFHQFFPPTVSPFILMQSYLESMWRASFSVSFFILLSCFYPTKELISGRGGNVSLTSVLSLSHSMLLLLVSRRHER